MHSRYYKTLCPRKSNLTCTLLPSFTEPQCSPLHFPARFPVVSQETTADSHTTGIQISRKVINHRNKHSMYRSSLQNCPRANKTIPCHLDDTLTTSRGAHNTKAHRHHKFEDSLCDDTQGDPFSNTLTISVKIFLREGRKQIQLKKCRPWWLK